MVEFRELRSAAELALVPPFEQRIWGSADDLVPVSLFVAVVSEGGLVLGAFEPQPDGRDRIVGVVFGFPTADPEVHHSHYLAVDPALRRQGLGVELKQRQREWCLARGVRRIRWTYDPLQLANGHLNLVALGARGVAYHVDHYGSLGGINGGLPSDRLTVSWELAGAPPVPDGTDVETVEVPPVTPEEIAAASPAALAARLAVRAALVDRLADGWVVTGVDRATRTYQVAHLHLCETR